MKETIAELRNQFESDLQTIAEASDFQRVRDHYFSRKNGRVTLLMKELGKLTGDERRDAGKLINDFKDYAESQLEARQEQLKQQTEAVAIERERIDITMLGRRPAPGSAHPIVRARQRMEDIFISMGYEVEDGPEIDTTFYNCDSLNIPAGHPAREAQDTFYVSPEFALRS